MNAIRTAPILAALLLSACAAPDLIECRQPYVWSLLRADPLCPVLATTESNHERPEATQEPEPPTEPEEPEPPTEPDKCDGGNRACGDGETPLER